MFDTYREVVGFFPWQLRWGLICVLWGIWWYKMLTFGLDDD